VKTRSDERSKSLFVADRLVAKPLPAGLSLSDVFREHFLWIDGNEFAGTAGEDYPALVADLGDIVMDAPADLAIATFGDQGLPKWHRTKIFHFHFAS